MRIVGRRLSEAIDANGIFFKLIGLASGRPLGQEPEQAAESFRVPENLAVKNPFDLSQHTGFRAGHCPSIVAEASFGLYRSVFEACTVQNATDLLRRNRKLGNHAGSIFPFAG